MKCSLDIFNFLEEISSHSHSIFFPRFVWSVHLRRLSYLSLLLFGTLHSDGYIFLFLFSLSLLFFSQLFVRPPQTTILPSCISFSLGWFWSLPPIQCYELPSTVLQAVCLTDLTPWIYLSLLLYNYKGFYLGHTEFRSFPYFLQFKPEFCKKELMIWATVGSRSCFCRMYRVSPFWMQRI